MVKNHSIGIVAKKIICTRFLGMIDNNIPSPACHFQNSSYILSTIKDDIRLFIYRKVSKDVIYSFSVLAAENEIVIYTAILQQTHHGCHLDQLGFCADKNMNHELSRIYRGHCNRAKCNTAHIMAGSLNCACVGRRHPRYRLKFGHLLVSITISFSCLFRISFRKYYGKN